MEKRIIAGIEIDEEKNAQDVAELEAVVNMQSLTEKAAMMRLRRNRGDRKSKCNQVRKIEKKATPEVELSLYDAETGTWKLNVDGCIDSEKRQQDAQEITESDSFSALLSQAGQMKSRRSARA